MKCFKCSVRKSIGPAASWCSKPARSRARPTARCWRPTAAPRCLHRRVRRRSRSPASISSRSPSTTRKRPSPPAKSRAAFSSAKAGPTEKEILTSRLIDRPIRPLFPEGYPQRNAGRRDRARARSGERSRHRGAWSARSAALTISGIPVHGPDRAAPASATSTASSSSTRRWPDSKTSTLDLVVAGTKEGVLMVESEAQGAARRRHAGRRHVRPIARSSR